MVAIVGALGACSLDEMMKLTPHSQLQSVNGTLDYLVHDHPWNSTVVISRRWNRKRKVAMAPSAGQVVIVKVVNGTWVHKNPDVKVVTYGS